MMISILLCIGLTSCFSSCDEKKIDRRNPLINSDEFRDFGPWWIPTNSISTNNEEKI